MAQFGYIQLGELIEGLPSPPLEKWGGGGLGFRKDLREQFASLNFLPGNFADQ
jgi:hypothetical protein